MLQPLTDGKHFYEVNVYNREVRAAVKDNESHCFYGDHWADLQTQDVLARDESEAWKLVTERYPPDKGFVVEALIELSH